MKWNVSMASVINVCVWNDVYVCPINVVMKINNNVNINLMCINANKYK